MAKQTFTTGQVLTAAQMTSLQQTAMGGGSTTAKTASYTLVAADAGTVVQMNSATATTITVNTALFAAGDTVQIQNVGAGVCTITAGTATVNTSATLALKQYDAGTLYFNSTSAAIFFAVDAADTPASGMVFLNRTTFTNVATVDIDYFSSSYFTYMVMIESISASTGTDDIQMRLRYGSTTETSNIYYNATQRLTFAGSASTLLAAGVGSFQMFPDNSSTYGGTKATLYFNQVGNASELASFRGVWQCGDTSSSGFTGGNIATANTYTGFRLLSASTNITGAVSVYGLAKA